MEPLLEWVVQRQLRKIEPHDVASADSGMHNSEALSKNLWGYLNLALSGSTQANEFLKVKRLNCLEAWRRIVAPLEPCSEAKRNALHTSVHNPPKSKSLASVIGDLDEWEKVVEQFELCGGVISDDDRRAVLLKKLPATVHSSLVSSLRKCRTYTGMKAQLEDEMVFLSDEHPTPRTCCG